MLAEIFHLIRLMVVVIDTPGNSYKQLLKTKVKLSRTATKYTERLRVEGCLEIPSEV